MRAHTWWMPGRPLAVGGPFVEHPLGCTFAAAEALGEDVVVTPPCEHRFFERDEVERGHGIERHPCTLRAPPEALRTEMAHWNDCYTVERDAVVLRVHVQPSAGRTAIVGRHGDAVKLRVAAPPVDDRANVAVAELLADLFGIKTGDVELVSGGKSRVKRFRLKGVDVDTLDARLDAAVDATGGPRAARH